MCDVRCLLNGECDNGTCICQVGWNGQYCSIVGCPEECNGRGNCEKVNGYYWWNSYTWVSSDLSVSGVPN